MGRRVVRRDLHPHVVRSSLSPLLYLADSGDTDASPDLTQGKLSTKKSKRTSSNEIDREAVCASTRLQAQAERRRGGRPGAARTSRMMS